MKILFYGTKPYDKYFFSQISDEFKDIEITFIEPPLSCETAMLANGYDAVCAFVNMDICRDTINCLSNNGIRAILMRCAGFNNVDMKAAQEKNIKVLTVPSYSPQAVAEHAMALVLTANRRTHKAYVRGRENDFSLSGLMGVNLYGKTAGVIGTGKIGMAFAEICRGFGMNILGFDKIENSNFIKYVSLDELLSQSDVISLHCPLTDETYHMINNYTINKMKNGVILVNTSRGGLIKTADLIDAIKKNKFFAVGLDVYEEENGSVFEDLSENILTDSTVAVLLSFPNVILTSHQGFFTREAISAISQTTMENARTLALV